MADRRIGEKMAETRFMYLEFILVWVATSCCKLRRR
jgi:hypothetical protein